MTPSAPFFTDATGRTWQPQVAIPALRRLRDQHHLLLVGEQLADVIETVHRDPVLVVDLLFAILNPGDVSKAQFEALFDEKTIESATPALLEALIAAVPNAKDRERMRTAIVEYRAALQKLRDVEVLATGVPAAAVAKLAQDAADGVARVEAEHDRATNSDVLTGTG